MTTDKLYELFLQNGSTVTTDSRNCPKDSLFFALKGDNFNGNQYAPKAIEAGCAYAIIDDEAYKTCDRCILVEDALLALQSLARTHRISCGTPIIGITGTNGKTTTKELIAAVLKEKFKVHFTQGNLNNHIGVPLTLLQLTDEHDIAIIEMGANHPGEIKLLADIACPNVGIITNVGKAHLEGFGSFEGVQKTKKELYDFIGENQGFILRNMDNELLEKMADDIPVQGYSMVDEQAYVYGTITNQSGMLQMRVKCTDETIDVNTNLIGGYNAENVLAAVTAGVTFGLSASQIKHGIENYVPKNNRSMLVETKANKVVVDAYNANPTSMRAAIENIIASKQTNTVFILGDMLELGSQSHEEHQNIIALLEQNGQKNVFLVGEHFQKTHSQFPCFANTDALSEHLCYNPVTNSYILLKGSRGIHLENIMKNL